MKLEDEMVVLVNEKGEPIGEANKLATHHSDTPLHLAFSCYVFNSSKQLLITKRFEGKKVWPGVWTNSVCGHPSPGETVEEAIIRRADYELGISLSDLSCVINDYVYRTPLFNGVIDHEFCPVYFAMISESEVMLNPEEVSDYKWVNWDDYKSMLVERADEFSYWSKDQMKYFERLNISPDILK